MLKLSTKLIILFLLVLLNNISSSQVFGTKNEVDELQKELATCREDSTRVRLLYNLGHISFIKRLGYWDSVLQLAKLTRLNKFQGRVYNKLGYITRNNNNLTESIELLKKGISVCDTINDKNEIISLLNNLSQSYLTISDYNSAINCGFKGLALAEQVNDKQKQSTILRSIGSGFSLTGDHKKALHYCLKSERICEEIGFRLGLFENQAVVANYYELTGDLIKAHEYYYKARNNMLGFERNPVAIDMFSGLGSIMLQTQQNDSALHYFNLASKLALEVNDMPGYVNSQFLIAQLFYKKEDFTKAKLYAEEIYPKTKELKGMLPQMRELELMLATIYSSEKKYEQAFKYMKLYSASKDSVTNEESRKLAAQKEFDYNLEKKDNENRLLAQQNQIQTLQIQQNKYLVWGIAGFAILIVAMALLVLRQNRLKAQQQTSQLEQKLLRSQMNPHFIFNSLQAIQNFVLKNDTKAAVSYLSSFAAVTRNVLENSRMDSIPLKKEIALMQNYLHLQKLRFGNRFDFEIHFDEHVDPETINIPPMLAQPFIENAVEHGMHGLEKTGKIDVYYTLKDSFLLIEIIDNGSGMKTENVTGKQHQSMAIEITKERLALMNKKQKEKTFFNITDAFPNEPQQKGVKVTFNISTRLLAT